MRAALARLAAATAALTAAGAGASAQRPPDLTIDPFGAGPGPAPGAACAAPEYRQFDFWVGQWQVVTPTGSPSGTNVISRELGGCAVEERWTDGGGGRGRSINAYDPTDRRWHQHWVFAAGGPARVVHYAGRLVQGRMVLGGARTFPGGTRVQDLGVWIAHSPDSVQQEFYTIASDTSSPNVFDGRYLRRPTLTLAPERAFPTCGARPRSHDLDFALGSWDVYVADPRAPDSASHYAARGQPAGRSEIRADLSGCLLEERFAGRGGGYEALAYAAYNPASERWELTRADTRGTRLFLEAGASAPGSGGGGGGRLAMRGRSPLASDGATTVRVTWEPVDATSFRQRWERSTDGGATWRPML